MKVRKVLRKERQETKAVAATTNMVKPKKMGHAHPFSREGRDKWRDVAAKNFE